MADTSDKTDWLLQLIDKVTGPAKRAGKSVDDLAVKLKALELGGEKVTSRLERLGDSLKKHLVAPARRAKDSLAQLTTEMRKQAAVQQAAMRAQAQAYTARAAAMRAEATAFANAQYTKANAYAAAQKARIPEAQEWARGQYGRASAYASRRAASARGWAGAQYARVRAWSRGQYDRARAYLDERMPVAAQWARGQYSRARDWASARYPRMIGWAQQQSAKASAYATANYPRIKEWAENTYAGAKGFAGSERFASARNWAASRVSDTRRWARIQKDSVSRWFLGMGPSARKWAMGRIGDAQSWALDQFPAYKKWRTDYKAAKSWKADKYSKARAAETMFTPYWREAKIEQARDLMRNGPSRAMGWASTKWNESSFGAGYNMRKGGMLGPMPNMVGELGARFADAVGIAGRASARAGQIWKKFAAGIMDNAHNVTATFGLLYGVLSGDTFRRFGDSISMAKARFAQLMAYAQMGSLAFAAAGGAMVKQVIDMAMFAESARSTMANLTGDKQSGIDAFERGRALAMRFGMSIHDTVDEFKELLAMQFKVGEAEGVIKMAADLQDVTGDADAAKRAILAMTQIKAIGKLQGGEVQQLANAGLSTKLLYEAIAKRKGVSVEQAHALQSTGKIDAETGLGAIGDAIKRKLHISEFGQAADNYVRNAPQGIMSRLQHAPEYLTFRVAEMAKDEIFKLKPLVNSIIDKIEGLDVSKFSNFVGTVLKFADVIVTASMAFVDGFMAGAPVITRVLDAFSLGKSATSLAGTLGLALAYAVGMALMLTRKMAEWFVWLNDNRWVVYAWLGFKAFRMVYGVAFSIMHLVMGIKGALWLWRVFTAEAAYAGMGAFYVNTLRSSKVVQGLIGFVRTLGADLLKMYLTGPLAIMGWIAVIVIAGWLIYSNWESICDAMLDSWDKFVTACEDIANGFAILLGQPEPYERAGQAAGIAFVKGLAYVLVGWIDELLVDKGIGALTNLLLDPWLGADPHRGNRDFWTGKVIEESPRMKARREMRASEAAKPVEGGGDPTISEFMKQHADLQKMLAEQAAKPAVPPNVTQNIGTEINLHGHEGGKDTAHALTGALEEAFRSHWGALAAASGAAPAPAPAK